jgi:hypothetical protein
MELGLLIRWARKCRSGKKEATSLVGYSHHGKHRACVDAAHNPNHRIALTRFDPSQNAQPDERCSRQQSRHRAITARLEAFGRCPRRPGHI